ncbi:PP2C family protein-serine/threonine phosphatase [Streptomyces sp. DH8]|uniref:PP2C family protein-serine/threonine phosphatase n=1 Tax=Streptomyces sp. DH8 TaxID=2857008 RepID=UPI001E294320|nr:SpoIIE family protein phosphatase [Streptomyces sp. DH8]
MPSPLFADRPAPRLPAHDAVDALIQRTRRLRGDVDAVRRDTVLFDEDGPQRRRQRALCELAVHHLDHLDENLGRLRAGLPGGDAEGLPPETGAAPDAPDACSLPGRVGSAEWNLLTDECTWSDELYEIFGRPLGSAPLSLDDLPSVLPPEDQPLLTSMVTGCLVDGRPMDGEFRIVRPDGRTRTLHMTGEPVLDTEGCTASMWAVLRDVSELRHGGRTADRDGASTRHAEHIERTEHRLAVELRETVLPPWRGSLRLPRQGRVGLDIAAHHLPSDSGGHVGGDWYDAMELPDGRTLLTVGGLTGHGVPATSAMAMVLGALRGMAVAGIGPGTLMGHLDQVLEASLQPPLGSALCCRFDPGTSLLSWAQAGHPAPLLFRNGSGGVLPTPDGVPLGSSPSASYGQDEVRLFPGDVLVLHTEGLVRGAGPEALLALAPRFARARTAQECVRSLVEVFGGAGRLDDACVLVARAGA